MTDAPPPLSAQLMQQAIYQTDHPATAATALITAAAEILTLQFGAEGAITLMADIIHDAGSEWRRRHAN